MASDRELDLGSRDVAKEAAAGTAGAGREGVPAVSVVGCGNWQVRPDRIGPRVLAALAARAPAGVELADVGTTLLGLLDRLHGQELLVLVDACVGRAAPGTVEVVDPAPGTAIPPRATLHQIGPLETLAIARELYPELCPRRTRLVLIETGGLGPEAEAEVCARALAAIETEIGAAAANLASVVPARAGAGAPGERP